MAKAKVGLRTLRGSGYFSGCGEIWETKEGRTWFEGDCQQRTLTAFDGILKGEDDGAAMRRRNMSNAVLGSQGCGMAYLLAVVPSESVVGIRGSWYEAEGSICMDRAQPVSRFSLFL